MILSKALVSGLFLAVCCSCFSNSQAQTYQGPGGDPSDYTYQNSQRLSGTQCSDWIKSGSVSHLYQLEGWPTLCNTLFFYTAQWGTAEQHIDLSTTYLNQPGVYIGGIGLTFAFKNSSFNNNNSDPQFTYFGITDSSGNIVVERTYNYSWLSVDWQYQYLKQWFPNEMSIQDLSTLSVSITGRDDENNGWPSESGDFNLYVMYRIDECIADFLNYSYCPATIALNNLKNDANDSSLFLNGMSLFDNIDYSIGLMIDYPHEGFISGVSIGDNTIDTDGNLLLSNYSNTQNLGDNNDDMINMNNISNENSYESTDGNSIIILNSNGQMISSESVEVNNSQILSGSNTGDLLSKSSGSNDLEEDSLNITGNDGNLIDFDPVTGKPRQNTNQTQVSSQSSSMMDGSQSTLDSIATLGGSNSNSRLYFISFGAVFPQGIMPYNIISDFGVGVNGLEFRQGSNLKLFDPDAMIYSVSGWHKENPSEINMGSRLSLIPLKDENNTKSWQPIIGKNSERRLVSMNSTTTKNEDRQNQTMIAIQRNSVDLSNYQDKLIPDSAGYLPEEIYKDQTIKDNRKALNQLSVDKLHQEMVEQQYQLDELGKQ